MTAAAAAQRGRGHWRSAAWRRAVDRSRGRLFAEKAAQASAWDLFLKELGLSEELALVQCAQGAEMRARICEFVKRERFAHFVPEAVLAEMGMLGLMEQWNPLSVGGENQSARRRARLHLGRPRD